MLASGISFAQRFALTKRKAVKMSEEGTDLFKLGHSDCRESVVQVEPSFDCNVHLNFMRHLVWRTGDHDAVDTMAVLNVLHHRVVCRWQGSSIRQCVHLSPQSPLATLSLALHLLGDLSEVLLRTRARVDLRKQPL